VFGCCVDVSSTHREWEVDLRNRRRSTAIAEHRERTNAMNLAQAHTMSDLGTRASATVAVPLPPRPNARPGRGRPRPSANVGAAAI
jgi:hypothetical protein